MNQFSIGDYVRRKGKMSSDRLFPCTQKTYGKVIGFSTYPRGRFNEAWVRIEGEYYDVRGRREINYYNPKFLEKIEIGLIKKEIKNYIF